MEATEFERQIEELIRQSRKALREDLAAADLFQTMVARIEWTTYVRHLDKRIQAYSDVLLQPARSVDGMIAHEFIKGAMFGLVLARDLPSVTIAAMKDAKRPDADDEELSDANS